MKGSGGDRYYFRLIGGRRETNVKQRVVYHSPTGFSWGYRGSGPADLALNCLLPFFPPNSNGKRGTTPTGAPGFVSEGYVSFGKRRVPVAVARVYQDFKEQFIAPLPAEGGEILYATIEDWLVKTGATRSAEL